MKKLIILLLFGLLTISLKAQKSELTKLFQESNALDIKLKVSIKDIKKKTNDSTYISTLLHIKNESGSWDSLKIDTRARGIFRRSNCYFSPMRIKVSKPNAKGTILEGNKSLKLVLPCQNNDGKNALVLKEFIAYKMYEQITPYYFNSRLAHVDFTEVDGKKIKNFQLTGILIEDDDLVANRNHAKVMQTKLHPLALNDTAALYHDLFQFMIGNTDWSTAFQHNAKLIFIAPKKYIPLTYDFDMSGFVNPPYAEVNADLGISSVRERLYRGFCRNEPITQEVRKQIIEKEGKIIGVMNGFEKDFTPKDFADTKKYLGEFFKIMKDDKSFKENITDKCRKQ